MSIRLSTLRLLFAFAGIVVVLLSGLSGQVARADSTTLSYTGTEQNFVVPSGVTALSIVAVGAKGGDGQNSGLASPGAGGFGDRVAADLAVSPGQIVYINVGGNGGLITPGGNGGGSGGLATFDYSGGGGGGATDVRLVSHDETSRVIVAGGGGGGGAAGAFNHNAGSGGNAGSNGGNGFGSGGQTGTSSGPGLGGGSTGCGGSGAAGSGAAGGDGSGASGWSGGGGGGGGYFGGGGGSSENCVGGGGGGGGGSSTAGAGTSNVSVATDATGVPQVTIHWDAPAIVCGNGVVEAGEECDDGDLLPGDCCSPTCRNEPPTNSCTDNDACTAGDVCGGGTCAGTPISCHDNNVCTADGCDPTTGCVFTNNSNPCNDGNACTAGDRCNAGSCQSGSPVVCDDNNPCTTDVCDPETGCVYTNNTDACDDGNACTLGDVCGDGVCAGTAISCNDDNPCTTDTCGATGCIYTNNTNACDDGNVCTLGDVCGGGTCAGTAIACSDDNPCTTDTCNPATGCVFSNNTSPCDDGNACTLSDVCGGGTCAGSAITCNDNNPCTIDACTAFGCVHTNTANACNDGNACTSGDVCRHGACTGTAVACNDNNACTTDSCNPATGCVFTDNTSPCSDGNACTTGDACSGGACRGGAPRACNDNNACTTDTCNPATGCVFTNNTLACNDGNACTTNDACSGGACAGQAIAVANHLVISQIQTRGNGSAPARDEFIEIYNPTSASISAAHLAVRYKPVGSNAITTILNIPSTAAAVVPAHGWLLLTGSGYNGSATPDFTYASMDLPPGGGTVYLGPANGNVTCTSNKIIDKVAWGNGDCAETTPTAAPGANNSAARLPASTCGNGQDTNNNAADFIPMVPSTPRN